MISVLARSPSGLAGVHADDLSRSFSAGARAPMQRMIIGFPQDEAQDWVADVACGQQQHVRHTPPRKWRPNTAHRLTLLSR